MDDLVPVLVILFLIVAPILEKLMKAGRQAPPPPRPQQRRTRPAERQRLPDGRTMTTTAPADQPEARDASDLLPAELWEILTGQRPQERSGQRPEPEPQGRSEPEPAVTQPAPPVRPARKSMAERRAEVERKRAQRMAARRGEPGYDEEAAAADAMRRRDQEQATRRRYDHSAPEIVSLETEPAPEPVRHAAFHEKLDRLTQPRPRRQRVTGNLDLDLGLDLDDRVSLQRAILIQEVLGRPKGLD